MGNDLSQLFNFLKYVVPQQLSVLGFAYHEGYENHVPQRRIHLGKMAWQLPRLELLGA